METRKERYQRKLENRISEFAGSHMNNSKWSKLFRELAKYNELIGRCLIKDVFDSVLHEIEIPQSEDYLHAFHASGIYDVIIGGPYLFIEIEQIIFPRTWTINRQMRSEKLIPFQHEQNIEGIMKIIGGLGEFEMEIDNSELVLYAYK